MSLLYSENSNSMSRTHQYRKVMKPLLERKRRARINKSLDEIKDLLKDTLQAQSGESLNKLEKADILEMTVKYLRRPTNQHMSLDSYFSGYSTCTQHTNQYLSSIPGVNTHFASDLLSHLRTQLSIPPPDALVKPSIKTPPPQEGSIQDYRLSGSLTPPPELPRPIKTEFVWRPF
ncbi:HESN [Lepeophtheirus salmonis]|nr:HESN [Lepeophtheirus salmonis]CAF3003213.1 HESN [Lepeophtheirus salmonis]